MKTEAIVTGGIIVVMAMFTGSTGLAGNYDAYLHFVNHRDANGNLVWPARDNSAKPQKTSTFAAESDHEAALRKPVSSNIMPPLPQASSNLRTQTGPRDDVMPPEADTAQTPLVSDNVPPDRPTADPQPTPARYTAPYAQHPSDASPELNMNEESQEYPDDGLHISSQNTETSMPPAALPLEEVSPNAVPDVVTTTGSPDLSPQYGFRNTNWGMSIPEVKTKETAEFSWELDAADLVRGEHRLGYQIQIEGIDAVLTYSFENDRLVTAKYIYETDDQTDDAELMLAYKKIKSWITQLYGPPQSEEKLWVNELYRYAPELWGRAVMRGHLTMVDEWDVEGTSIMLLMNGDDETVGLIAQFTTNNLMRPTELVHVPTPFVGL